MPERANGAAAASNTVAGYAIVGYAIVGYAIVGNTIVGNTIVGNTIVSSAVPGISVAAAPDRTTARPPEPPEDSRVRLVPWQGSPALPRPGSGLRGTVRGMTMAPSIALGRDIPGTTTMDGAIDTPGGLPRAQPGTARSTAGPRVPQDRATAGPHVQQDRATAGPRVPQDRATAGTRVPQERATAGPHVPQGRAYRRAGRTAGPGVPQVSVDVISGLSGVPKTW